VNGSEHRTLTRIQNKQAVYSQDLQVSYWISGFNATPDGDAVIVSTDKIMTITQAGVLTSLTIVNGPPSGPFVVDKLNRLWFSGYDSTAGKYRVSTIDLATGTVKTMLDLGTTYNTPALYIDNAGANVYLTGVVANTITKINVDSNERKDISIPGSLTISGLAATSDGTVWGTQYMGGVFKLNTDGTASVYSSLPVGGRLFFDRADASTLWLSDVNGYASSVHKININTLADVIQPIGSQVSALIQNVTGGAWAITSDSGTTYYSALK
jgi:streptogramin lyase